MFTFLKHTFLHPLKEFLHDGRAIGILLLGCTFISLLFSNLPAFSNAYLHFWDVHFNDTKEHSIHVAFLHLPNSFLVIINDLLMAFFFLLAGMEIKREIISGELGSLKKSILPIFAAIGGMLIPALLFFIFNRNTAYSQGWAIPTATDIAFTLGVASLLGKRVPVALKIFITALAIIDDLGAIIVIALFYGGKIKLLYLVGCCVVIFALLLFNKYKIKFGIWYCLAGFILWYCMFNSGIHATVAGVVFAFLMPINQLSKWELKLHNPVYFLIMPIFALANTAIAFPTTGLLAINNSLSWGIILGLVVGKPLGICTFCYILIKNKYSKLPRGTNWNQMIGASILAGIGFTMSIFIATLAFSSPTNQNISKISVLVASFMAMIIGFCWLVLCKPQQKR